MSYKIDKGVLGLLVNKNIITSTQADQIWSHFESESSGSATFRGLHITYYFGGMICILAMTWLMNRGWMLFGGPGLTLISIAYMTVFTLAGIHFRKDKSFQIPSGLLLTIAVCITPLVVYGIQRWTGYWSQGFPGDYTDYHQWVKGSWVLMSLATVAVGGVYLHKFKFPFLTMPIAVALFYISMDIVPFIHSDGQLRDLRKLYSLWFGLAMILFSYLLDRRKEVDFSFWLYLFGLMAFWGGLTAMNSDSELGKFFYFLINLFLFFLSLFLYRRAFIVFGGVGVMIYLWHLAYKVFTDSLLFPVVLILGGLAIIYIGVQYQKNQKAIDDKFTSVIPPWLKTLRPQKG